ncbi:preprotein translocase subunit SecY [Thermomonospora umbrina]|uniref:Protein translocase subunit SecY n=1 Tax=Thermomonospora umbrina TaxID=111806 RepID=A0A3D9SQB1_9ACTN|nr:preprotein translocase subunit SecY [Thermomonospora umbrina]REE98142.1 protein translocase subunit secY/sec61 alpha [Thermomonospora umbrina]
MLTAITRAFRTPDLRKKLLFTLFIILIFRIGSQLPTPGVDTGAIRAAVDGARDGDQGQLYGLVDLFSGGALLKLSVFALGIMPYITASIILQLLTVVIPRLENLKKEGQAGTTKITQYTRYLTIGLAILQATGIVAMAATGRLFPNASDVLYKTDLFTIITMVVVMTAGTSVIMWLGELITDRGVGNGMSILIFTQVVAVFPAQFWAIYKSKGTFTFVIVMLVGLAIMAGVVFVEQAQRRIPVQYAKRMVGRRMYGGTSTYIPLKVNQAGIIPVIFASSLLYLPVLATQLWPENKWMVKLQPYLQQDNAWHMAVFFAFIIFFTYFYVAITFNPTEVADNMKKYGGFIPGIRPGRPTAEYLDYVLTRITTPGALYLGLVSLVPMVAFALMQAADDFPFGGTSILIVVGVGLDTVKQIESQLQQRNYEGFLR